MSLLDGGISRLFANAFAGIYLPATLTRANAAVGGDGSWVSGTPQTFACRAQVDSVTEAMRQQPGYTDTDRRIIVLANTLKTVPTTDDRITVRGEEFSIASVTSDPAQSYWELRGSRNG